MAAAGLEPMEDVTVTGFSDDAAIPTWAKGCVSSALSAGVIQGSRDDSGAPVFGAEDAITQGEATVMLNNLLDVADVPLEVFASEGTEAHWASQAAANLAASGVLREEETNSAALGGTLTRADAAELGRRRPTPPPWAAPSPGPTRPSCWTARWTCWPPGRTTAGSPGKQKHPPDCSGGCSFFA